MTAIHHTALYMHHARFNAWHSAHKQQSCWTIPTRHIMLAIQIQVFNELPCIVSPMTLTPKLPMTKDLHTSLHVLQKQNDNPRESHAHDKSADSATIIKWVIKVGILYQNGEDQEDQADKHKSANVPFQGHAQLFYTS